MLERDWFMRQVQQLVQALQQVLLQKQSDQIEEAHQTIQQAFGQVSEKEGTLRNLSLQEAVDFCQRDGSFRPEFAIGIADLLKEEGDLLIRKGSGGKAEQSYARALLLYRRAMKEKGAALPWDLGAKLQALEDVVPARKKEEIEAVLSGHER